MPMVCCGPMMPEANLSVTCNCNCLKQEHNKLFYDEEINTVLKLVKKKKEKTCHIRQIKTIKRDQTIDQRHMTRMLYDMVRNTEAYAKYND